MPARDAKITAAVEQLSAAISNELTSRLNQTSRRLRQAEDLGVWANALLDAVADFSKVAAVFSIDTKFLKLTSVRGPEVGGELQVPLNAAPAFAGVVESKETVVAAGTSRELSPAIAEAMGSTASKNVYLFPVQAGSQVAAILYVEDHESIDVAALELLSCLVPPPIGKVSLVQIGGASPKPPEPKPLWEDLGRAAKQAHLHAQRFARTSVAELILNRSNQVHEGRASNTLYRDLREEIDAGRENFRRQFMDTCPSMVDYYHAELVRTLAKGASGSLGLHYPGPLRH